MQPFKYNPSFNSGSFRNRITFQQFGDITDSEGFTVQDWQDVTTVWAMIKTMQGREYYAAAAVQAENTTRFVIRYTTGLSTKMRILYKDHIFDIQSIINDDEKDSTLTIIAKEVVPGG